MAAATCEAREMFLTNHALVLASLAGDPGLRMRDIADRVGVTERAVESIVRDLTVGGYVTKVRTGRRNRYRLHIDRPFQHPLVSHRSLSRLVQALVPDWDGRPSPADGASEEEPLAIPETRISCVQAESTLILHQTGQGQSGAEGGSVKRVLVYIAVASVMALATAAAAAAISRSSRPQPQPRHHVTRQAATAPVVAPGASVAAAGSSLDAVRRLHPAPRHARIAHRASPSRPVRGGAPAGGPPVHAPTPPSVSAGTTVTVGALGAGATVTAGSGGVTATVGSPVGGVGVSLGAPTQGGPPLLGITVGSPGP
jgi:DNA-binding Lrp family transcriptional regulator